MYFGFSEEEKMLKSSVRNLLSKHASKEAVRDFVERPAFSRELQRLIGQQGILGMVTKEDNAYTGIMMAIGVFEEAGKVLLPYPLMEGVLGAYALSKDASKAALYDAVVEGEQLLTMAWKSNGQPAAIENNGEYTANGSFYGVPFAQDADKILAFFQMKGTGLTPSQELALVVLNRDHPGITLSPMKSMDYTYPLYALEVSGYSFTANDIVLNAGDGGALQEELYTLGAVFSSSELVGISDSALYETVEYTKVRKQFGQEIAKFQALKHMAADMYVLLENSRVSTIYAGWAVESGTEPEAVSIAKAYSAEAALDITGTAIQMHGGIGFTWECDMHLYFKRARRAASDFGDIFTHRERVMQFVAEAAGR